MYTQYIIYVASNEVPGVHEFVAQNSPQTEPCFWTVMSQDDISHVHRELICINIWFFILLLNTVKYFLAELGNLSMTGLISEVKRLHDLAYQLGLEEAKEMTRGKYLNIFKHK